MTTTAWLMVVLLTTNIVVNYSQVGKTRTQTLTNANITAIVDLILLVLICTGGVK